MKSAYFINPSPIYNPIISFSPQRVYSRSPNSNKLYSTGCSYTGKNVYTIVEDKDLGKGTFGSVKLVKDRTSGKLYAMKIINKERIRKFRAEDNIRRELALQSKLTQSNILKLHEHFEDKTDMFMIVEYCSRGNLYQLLRRKKKLTEEEGFTIFHQICNAVDYLHVQGIVHRDIKPENVLFYEDNTVKLCDYNWAKKLNPTQKCDPMICGTTEYMPPEVVAQQAHDLKVDIWSLGILLYEFFHGELPYKGDTQKEKIASILANQLKISQELPQDLQQLINQILHRVADQRPSIAQIQRSKWFQRMSKQLKHLITPPRPQTVYTKGRGQQSERLSFFSNASQNTDSTAISKQRFISTEKKPTTIKPDYDFKHLVQWENKLKSSSIQHSKIAKIIPMKAFGLNSTVGFGSNPSQISSIKSFEFDDNPVIRRATQYLRQQSNISQALKTLISTKLPQ